MPRMVIEWTAAGHPEQDELVNELTQHAETLLTGCDPKITTEYGTEGSEPVEEGTASEGLHKLIDAFHQPHDK
jgi:hypothetical protein